MSMVDVLLLCQEMSQREWSSQRAAHSRRGRLAGTAPRFLPGERSDQIPPGSTSPPDSPRSAAGSRASMTTNSCWRREHPDERSSEDPGDGSADRGAGDRAEASHRTPAHPSAGG
jgi:hypothetical protein